MRKTAHIFKPFTATIVYYCRPVTSEKLQRGKIAKIFMQFYDAESTQ